MDLGTAGAALGVPPDGTVEEARTRYVELAARQPAGRAAPELDQALLAYVLAAGPATTSLEPGTRLWLRRAGIVATVLGAVAVAVAAGLPLLRPLVQRGAVGAPVQSSVPGVVVPATARTCAFTDKDTDVRRPGLTETRYCLPSDVSASRLRRWYAEHQPATAVWPGWVPCGGTRLVNGAQQVQWAEGSGARRGYVEPAESSAVSFVVVFSGPTGGCA
ncbi:MAG: hypothetical protein M3Z02_06870 [Actinomycetota bacterium]|nr:hypothetical protein [Actinomycetota bacterium]